VGAHNAALVEALRKVAEDNGLASRAAGSGSVESPMLVIEGLRPEAALGLTSTLRERGIHVALRGGRIRVTPHVHNGPEDVERFASALATWRRHA
jgi:selenocysteine lyase/cysteine desulfurase